MKEFNRITVKVYAWFAKPMNSSNGSSSFLMRGGETPYQYQGKTNVKVVELEEYLQANKNLILDDHSSLRLKAKEKESDAKISVSIMKEERGISRVVKGIRGALRHSVLNILHKKGIAYCSPTIKEKFQKSEESTLLDGEHIMGGCGATPCPVRQLFGILSEPSPIRVWSDVIVQTDKPLERIVAQKGLSYVYVSTETRHASRRDGKAIQDFSEQYFSGEFKFYVEFSKELPIWLLGLLVEGILSLTHLGAGSNSGYGRLEIKDIAYEQVSFQRALGAENNGTISITETEEIRKQNNLLQEYVEAWSNHN